MKTLMAAVTVGLLGMGSSTALAADWPTKPVTLVSAWTPGGANDIIARSLAKDFNEEWGQSVIVENRPGASGTIGTAHVARSAPDGYTLTLGSLPSYSTAELLYDTLSYDPKKDFTPISMVAIVPNLLVVNQDLPVNSVKELIEYAKKNPGKLSFSSVGNGSSSHLAGELFNRLAQVETIHIPYKGTAPAMIDLVGGRVTFAFENMPALLPMIEDKKLKALAVTSKERSPLLPEVPTMIEAGLADFEMGAWYGLFGPAGMRPAVVEKINGSVRKSLDSPEMNTRLKALGANVIGSTPAQAEEFLLNDIQKWTAVLKAAPQP
ncbi:MAG: tripartite tricarboxylate transporter substrate binding protein [Pigmentiphaga sp.]